MGVVETAHVTSTTALKVPTEHASSARSVGIDVAAAGVDEMFDVLQVHPFRRVGTFVSAVKLDVLARPGALELGSITDQKNVFGLAT